MLSSSLIKQLATNEGFDLCGIAPAKSLTENEMHFRRWLDRGYHSSLGFLERSLDKRFDVRALVEGAQTVVVCAVGYKNDTGEGYPAGCRTKVASYARCRDYHTSLRGMLGRMFAALQQAHPSLQGRVFADTAPLLEKQWAVEAGLGWIGRQSLLVTPSFGSYVLLGELVLTLPADDYDTPFEGARCGRCHNCVESCPTGAIVEPHLIDTARCISCRTQYGGSSGVGTDEADGPGLDGWIFGCDACQSGCPYNQKAPMHRHTAFDPLFDPRSLSSEAWLAMSEPEFAARFAETPLGHTGLERIQKNVLLHVFR